MNQNHIRIFWIIGISCLIQITNVAAQESGKTKLYGGMGYFMIGWQGVNLDGFNDHLVNNGYPELNNNMITIGGGGHSIIGRFIIGGEGHGIFSSEASNKDYKSSLGGGYGWVNLGYVAYAKSGFILYPILGVGGGGMTYNLSEQQKSLSFQDIMDDPNLGTELSTGGFILNFSAGIDYVFNMDEGENNYGGLMLGLRAGYLYCTSSQWQYRDQNIVDPPEQPLRGFYVKLLIGGGGFTTSGK